MPKNTSLKTQFLGIILVRSEIPQGMKYELRNIEGNATIKTAEIDIALGRGDTILIAASQAGGNQVWQIERVRYDFDSSTAYLACRLIETPRSLQTTAVF